VAFHRGVLEVDATFDRPEAQAFASAWQADPVVHETETLVRTAEDRVRESLNEALAQVDSAMRRIADKYEHEPRD
jgi:hypothetical protein